MLHIYTIPVTPFAQNARVLYDPESKTASIIDPGGDLDRLWQVINQLNPSQLSVVLTHAHIDHAGATAACLERGRHQYASEVPLYAHSDGLLRRTISQQARLYGLPATEYCDAPEPDKVLTDGDYLVVGKCQARVLWTPGHAPDHLSFYFENMEVVLHEDHRVITEKVPVLIAGDALFAGSIGRTDLPGGSLKVLLRSIHDKLLVLPDDTLVLSGHGPPTTIGHEKRTNPFLQD